MKTVAVVPIKLNNSRLPNKNIKPFKNGKPLCWYILKTLLDIKEIDDVYVYCSKQEICNYIPQRVKFLERGFDLDQDTTKMNEVLKRFQEDVVADIYVMSHTTAPFIKAESIRKGIQAVVSGQHDSAFAVKVIQDFLWKEGKPFNYSLDSIPRTQDLDVLYCETSGFYIYKRELIQKFNRRIGFNPFLVQVGEMESIDIDEYEDFEIANAVFNFFYSKGDQL